MSTWIPSCAAACLGVRVASGTPWTIPEIFWNVNRFSQFSTDYLPTVENCGKVPNMTLMDVTTAMDTAADTVRLVLRAVKRHLGLTDEQLGAAIGKKGHYVQERIGKNAAVGFSAADLRGFSLVLDIPSDVLLNATPEEAVRYLLDHPSEQRMQGHSCCSAYATAA